MKTKTLCATALLALVASATIGGTAFADEHSVTGKGDITFEQDTDLNDDKKPDPEDPTKDVDPKDPDDETKNTNGGAITIDRVSNLKFGTKKIDVTPGDKTYKAAAVEVTQKDKESGAAIKEGTRGPWVQWTDKRAGTNHKYQIKAALTKQFTLAGKTDTLAGASIQYKAGLLNSEQPLANWPTTAVQDLNLTATNGKQLVFDNNASTGSVGIGTWTAEYGQSSDYKGDNARNDASTGAAGESVILTVPGGQSISIGTYTADITWSIEWTPA